MNRLFRTAAAATAALAVSTSLAACDSSSGGSADAKVDKLNIVVPADAGGGWDQTGRAFQAAAQDEKILKSASVVNVPGAGGTVGLAKLANERDPNTLMVMGLVMVGAIETNHASAQLSDTTPIAELTEEQEVIVVPADSDYQSVQDLVDDIKANGQKVSIAGGSAGGTDQILAGQLLKAAGMESADIAKSLNYVPYSGGGESLAALLGGKVSAGISGVGEYAEQVKAGKLRALAVSGDEPAALLPDAPTLKDSGIDLVLTNWRGVVAPGNIDDAKKKALIEMVTKVHDSAAWKKALEDNDWADAFSTGDSYGTFVDDEVTKVKTTLKDIGLVQ
ncbi:MAG TPA: tripartite tricarboxylate transporter substrate binding protein [Nocardioides sp.]|nr:tripartite tricarboxylate transporter substrate binding protein [Nocardioides sp.]